MKTTKTVSTLTVLLISTLIAVADGTEKKNAKTSAAKSSKKEDATATHVEKDIVLTGSHLRQSVRRSGRITDGADHVIVLDMTTISHSGAGDLKQLLAREGVR
jgi:3-hydroxyisobutyrate dehydrogenase-like beta-hydroxyacid dehydrogenase